MSAQGLGRLVGLQISEVSADAARGRAAIRPELTQRSRGACGAVFSAIAESLASEATARAVDSEGKTAAALTSQSTFLRPVSGGSIHAVAMCKHRGRTTWVWEVEMSDDEGALCALTRMTIAVRDLEAVPD
jgi:uncharacterized protein (TIGR00369 family)